MRFAAARDAVADRRWAEPLAAAARHSLDAVPRLAGRTLVVVTPEDTAAATFGLTIAQRCAAGDVVSVDGLPFRVVPGESPLHALLRWRAADHPHPRRAVGHRVPPDAFAGHDRVVVADEHLGEPDELAGPDVPAEVPVYAWQSRDHRPNPTDRPLDPCRLVLYGLTDAAYGVVPLVEAARRGEWPF